jgi:DNA polymerase-3 subunit epsilon
MYTQCFWIDTETTGLDARKNFAFQISYLIEEGGGILIRRTLEMRPQNYHLFKFDKAAEHVHGYSKEKIIALPDEAEQFKLLLADIENYRESKLTIAGYNVYFDIQFLKALFGRMKIKMYNYFDRMPCDVLQLAQNCRVVGKLPLDDLKLGTVCGHFGISTKGAHNSMIDILNTREIFKIMHTR